MSLRSDTLKDEQASDSIQDLLSQVTPESLNNALRRRSLLEFTKHTFGESPSYDVNWHHKLVCDKLDEWVDGDLDRLIITMPPRHGKSELVSRRLPAYLLGRFPSDNIIGTSYGGSLARRMNRDVQRIIDSRRYREIFPNVILPRSTDIKTGQTGYVRTTNMFEVIGYKGAYISAGVGGSITGMGGDWVIIDDPIKNMQDAMSQTMRDKVWEWYSSTLYTRLESGAKILVTLTRWHSDDLTGRLIEQAKNSPDGDKWEVLSLPALSTGSRAEEDQRDEIDQALWSAKKDAEALKRTRESLPGKVWSSLYQQNPTPDDGSIWKRHYIR
ncbi:MAG: terminase family protein, partial [Actinobacteria bacterium]|nr:terminase family protein [Actinomycetota bacterium]